VIDDAIIRFDRVAFRYSESAAPVLTDVNLAIPEGQLCLVIGPTGAGKSTLLQLVNGLAPHFTGGRLTGTVSVDGRLTRSHPPRELADLVGAVGQDAAAGFVTSRVDDELAYGMEQLGLPDAVMRTRVEEVVDLLGLEKLRHRPLDELSAGEQQRVAIGSVLTSHPRVLVLDEPTSALDPGGAEEVLAAILRLVHDLGITVLMAEHRLERVIQYADSIVLVGSDGSVRSGDPATMIAGSRLAPPVVELGRVAGWHPLPLSIRDARRVAGDLRDRLRTTLPPHPAAPGGTDRTVALRARRLSVRYGSVHAVHEVDLTLFAGEVAALMGRNGSGKSSLLWALQGSGARSGGRVALARPAGEMPRRSRGRRRRSAEAVGEVDPASLSAQESIEWIALVPQNPTELLYLDSVAAECRVADQSVAAAPGTTAQLLDRLAPGLSPARHPRDLSEGQRLALALAVQLVGEPHVLLLDEPTRGLDYDAKGRLSTVLRELAARGTAVLLSSHDVEFVARAADRVVVMAGGESLTDAPVRESLTASPSFAPQVARILSPLPLLTVDEVRSAEEGPS
jgi:energy-coupling factor transport system ATP-binding protein